MSFVMGDKIEARRVMHEAGLPIVPAVRVASPRKKKASNSPARSDIQ